jgi:hypothetical protein
MVNDVIFNDNDDNYDLEDENNSFKENKPNYRGLA